MPVYQSILKEISPGCSLEGLMLKLKLQYFGHLMRRADSFEKTLMLGPEACGIFQDQGSNLCPLHWQVDSQPLDHQRSPKPTLVLVWSQAGYSFSLLETSLPSAGALTILGPWLQGLNV